jgi:hypothetical protein
MEGSMCAGLFEGLHPRTLAAASCAGHKWYHTTVCAAALCLATALKRKSMQGKQLCGEATTACRDLSAGEAVLPIGGCGAAASVLRRQCWGVAAKAVSKHATCYVHARMQPQLQVCCCDLGVARYTAPCCQHGHLRLQTGHVFQHLLCIMLWWPVCCLV